MHISANSLMQVNHSAYPYFLSPKPIREECLPAFFDFCSKALNEFVIVLNHTIESEMGQTEMFTIMDEMIDTFHELMENDEPEEFFLLKEHFENALIPSFQDLMVHLARCVDKPEPLKRFYGRLGDKVVQAYEHHILGSE